MFKLKWKVLLKSGKTSMAFFVPLSLNLSQVKIERRVSPRC